MTFSIERSSSRHRGLQGYRNNDDSDVYWMKSVALFLLLCVFLDKQWEMFGSLCFSRRWCKDDCSFKALLSTPFTTSVQYIFELHFPIRPLLLWTRKYLSCQSSSLWVTFLFMSWCFPSNQKLIIGAGWQLQSSHWATLRAVRGGHQARNSPDSICFSGENSVYHGLMFHRTNHISSKKQHHQFRGFSLGKILSKYINIHYF